MCHNPVTEINAQQFKFWFTDINCNEIEQTAVWKSWNMIFTPPGE